MGVDTPDCLVCRCLSEELGMTIGPTSLRVEGTPPPQPDGFVAASSCRVYLVRHRRTALSAQERFQALEDLPLDDVGWEEARQVAAGLRRKPLVDIYSSPLQRAIQTASGIASRHRLPVLIVPNLTDLDYGAWAGRAPEEVASVYGNLYGKFVSSPEEVSPPGGKGAAALRLRVEHVLHWMAEGRGNRVVAAVTHELPVRLVVAGAESLHGAAFWRPWVPTGSVTEMVVRPRHIRAQARREP